MEQTWHKQRANLAILTEATPGTWMTMASVFVAANCKLPFRNLKIKISNKEVERFVDRASLLALDSLFYGEQAEISFDVDGYTSGIAGTDTAFAPILKSCMAATVTAGTSVVYALNSSSMVHTSIGAEFISEDGTASQRFGFKGCRLTKLQLELTVGGQPIWHVTLKGPIAWETVSTVLTPIVQVAATPIASITRDALNGNIPQFKGLGFTIGGVQRFISKLTLDWGLGAEEFVDVTDPTTIQRYVQTAIKPTLTIDPTLTPAATVNDFAAFFAGTTAPLSLPIGGGAGKTITIAAPRLQRKTTDNGERGSFRTAETVYRLSSNTDIGDEALTLTMT